MAKQPNNKRKENINKKDKKIKKKKKSKVWGKILILLILILVALIGLFIYKSKQNGGGLQGMLSILVGHDEETLKNLEPIQVLLMGKSTDQGAELTDTIIVATYNPQTQNASLLSIPRDTFVGKNPTTGTGTDKINALYRKSPEKTLEAINKLTGLEVKYYMVIDNQALIELVDIIGGVEFDVPINMKYDDRSQNLHINLKKGLQVLDGDKAEQLIRFRKNNDGTTYPKEYGGDDYGRMRTQREFIMATAKQTIQAKNILKVKDIIDLVYEYVETNISISIIKDYVPYAVNIDISTIQSAVIPGGSYGPPTYPLWFFIPDKDETEALMEQLYGTGEDEIIDEPVDGDEENDEPTTNETTTDISKTETSQIKVELINGTESDKALTAVKKLLKDKGYQVTTKTTTSTSKTTIINKTDVDTKFTDNIKELLEVGIVSTSSVSSSDVDISIILGKDYNK
ncbi:MAG: LCP family protein [Clostridia bacterium]|nr:LCP family protein [Clostridia bacterium]